jgi:hypothetical protein
MSETHAEDAPPPDPAAAPPSPAVVVEPPPQPAEPGPATPEPVAGETPTEPPPPPEVKPHTDEPTLLSLAEVKPEGEAPPATEEAKPDDTKPEGEKPVEVEYKFELPEGREFPQEALDQFVGLARESGIAPEVAQKLMGLHVAALEAHDNATLQYQHDSFGKMRGGWQEEIKGDPELGGAGFDTNRSLALKGILAIVPRERLAAFDKALELTGMGDNPEFFRAMVTLGKIMADPVPPGPAAAPPPGNQRPTPQGEGGRIGYRYPRGRGRVANG